MTAVANMRRLALKQVLPLALALALFVLLRHKIAELDFAAIRAGLGQVSPLAWAAAACLSAVSFWAVGRYDRVVHGVIGTGIGGAEASRAGATSIAVAQTLGFGVVSGALVRWRLLPDLSLLGALRLSLSVSLSFLAGWAVVCALAVALLPITLPFPASRALALAVLAGAGLLATLSLWRPALLARLRLPSLRAMGLIVMLVLLDTLMAGAALYVLLPGELDIALPVFLAAFLIALGAGLFLATPGGVGPFEVMLLSLLPGSDQAALLGAVLGFRLVYYALPALIGAAVVIRGPFRQASQKAPEIEPAPQGAALEALIARAPEAEAGLLRQGRLQLLAGSAMVAPLGQSLVQLRGAVRPDSDPARMLSNLERAAQARFLAPCLYKAPARLAAQARRAGWQVLAIARDGWIDLASWQPQGRPFRQLRRKLRRAERAGVVIARADSAALPLEQMARINDEWSARRGGERGFSMGVFDAQSLARSHVWLAFCNGQLIGFLSLIGNGREQVLDLMRYGDEAPDGTMHLALMAAIEGARADGFARLSLAAVPLAGSDKATGALTRLRARLDRISGAAGLLQFKQSFAPNWRPLYMAAPNRRALLVAGLEIAREITRANPRQAGANVGPPHVQHAGFEFAPQPDPWQQAGRQAARGTIDE